MHVHPTLPGSTVKQKHDIKNQEIHTNFNSRALQKAIKISPRLAEIFQAIIGVRVYPHKGNCRIQYAHGCEDIDTLFNLRLVSKVTLPIATIKIIKLWNEYATEKSVDLNLLFLNHSTHNQTHLTFPSFMEFCQENLETLSSTIEGPEESYIRKLHLADVEDYSYFNLNLENPIKSLSKLKILALRSFNLCPIAKDSISCFTNLKSLETLSLNAFSFEIFPKLQNLTSSTFHLCHFNGKAFSDICNLTTLQKLHFHACNFFSKAMPHDTSIYTELTKLDLKELSIELNYFKDSDFAFVTKMTSLEFLNINANACMNNPKYLTHLVGLKHLVCSKIGYGILPKLTDLKYLKINNLRQLDEILYMRQLKVLDLTDGIAISTLQVSFVQDLSMLRLINLMELLDLKQERARFSHTRTHRQKKSPYFKLRSIKPLSHLEFSRLEALSNSELKINKNKLYSKSALSSYLKIKKICLTIPDFEVIRPSSFGLAPGFGFKFRS